MFSEINYNSEIPSSVALTVDPTLVSDDLVFVEILNPTGTVVDLSD